jgi:hypothetical protein
MRAIEANLRRKDVHLRIARESIRDLKVGFSLFAAELQIARIELGELLEPLPVLDGQQVM